MQDYSNLWSSYLEYCQRSWQDMSRLWFPAGLPNMGGLMGAQSGKKEVGKEATKPSLFPSTVSPENWMAFFAPWMPKVEASIEPLMEEAARVSMRVFMPWSGDPLWVEALVGKQEKPKAAPAPTPAKKSLPHPKTPAEVEVNNAIKRSRMQD